MGRLHKHAPSKYYYSYGPHEPAVEIEAGDTVETSTIDALNGDRTGCQIPEEARHRMEPSPPGLVEANPLTGPFYIKGAKPGDLLAVHIETLAVNRDFGFSDNSPGFGVFCAEAVRADGGYFAALVDSFPGEFPRRHYVWTINHDEKLAEMPLSKGRLDRVRLPLRPFLGCIGVAARPGTFLQSVEQAGNGGNMDCPDVREGTTIYLPVLVEGAFLFMGDSHAVQGDGEISGGGVEVTSDVRFSVELVKNSLARWPRLEDDACLMTAGIAYPLIEAYRVAHAEMIAWLERSLGLDRFEALQLVSQGGSSRVCNVVSKAHTVVARLPKALLGGQGACMWEENQ